jgi:hypothetical protein
MQPWHKILAVLDISSTVQRDTSSRLGNVVCQYRSRNVRSVVLLLVARITRQVRAFALRLILRLILVVLIFETEVATDMEPLLSRIQLTTINKRYSRIVNPSNLAIWMCPRLVI